MKIKNFGSIVEAALARNLLKTKGIESVVGKGNLGTAGEFTGAVGDADLFVSENKLEKARKILENTKT